MMIDNLIELIERRLKTADKFADTWIDLETTYAEIIIDILRAGKKMRNGLKLRVFDQDVDLEEPWIEVHLEDEDLAIEGAQDWDAALGEKE